MAHSQPFVVNERGGNFFLVDWSSFLTFSWFNGLIARRFLLKLPQLICLKEHLLVTCYTICH